MKEKKKTSHFLRRYVLGEASGMILKHNFSMDYPSSIQ